MRGVFHWLRGGLYPAEQNQNQQNHQNRTNDPRWPVTPTSGVREDRQTADQQENEDNDQNCADAHDEFLLVYLVRGHAVQASANLAKNLYCLNNPTVGRKKRFWQSVIKNNIFI